MSVGTCKQQEVKRNISIESHMPPSNPKEKKPHTLKKKKEKKVHVTDTLSKPNEVGYVLIPKMEIRKERKKKHETNKAPIYLYIVYLFPFFHIWRITFLSPDVVEGGYSNGYVRPSIRFY